MKISLSTIFSIITVMIGLIFDKYFLWIPISIFIASIIYSFARRWTISDEIGSWTKFSLFIKFFLSFLGFYATIGQIICVFLIIYWFLF